MPTWGERFIQQVQQRRATQPAGGASWRDLVSRVQRNVSAAQQAQAAGPRANFGWNNQGSARWSQQVARNMQGRVQQGQQPTSWMGNAINRVQQTRAAAGAGTGTFIQRAANAIRQQQQFGEPTGGGQPAYIRNAPPNWRNWGQAGSGFATTPPAGPPFEQLGRYIRSQFAVNEGMAEPQQDMSGFDGGYGSGDGGAGTGAGTVNIPRWWLDMMSWRV